MTASLSKGKDGILKLTGDLNVFLRTPLQLNNLDAEYFIIITIYWQTKEITSPDLNTYRILGNKRHEHVLPEERDLLRTSPPPPVTVRRATTHPHPAEGAARFMWNSIKALALIRKDTLWYKTCS